MPGGDTNHDNEVAGVIPTATRFIPNSFGNPVGAYSRDAFSVILSRQTPSKVRQALADGAIPKSNRMQAAEWLEQTERERDEPQRLAELDLRAREVAAAELAATAAQEALEYSRISANAAVESADASNISAKEAQRNGRIALFGAVVSFVALIVAIAAFFKQV